MALWTQPMETQAKTAEYPPPCRIFKVYDYSS